MKIWKRWRRAVSMVCLVALLGGQVHAAEQAATSDSVVKTEPNSFSFGRAWTSFETDTNKFPARFIDDSKTTYWNAPNLAALGLAGAGTAVFQRNYDDKINRHFETHGNLPDFMDQAGDVVGSPVTHFAVTGAWYGVAAGYGNETGKDQAMTMMTALAITGATTMSLKWIANNDCPNGAEYGWPSGHTSSSVCVASVLDEFYGPEVGIPAYGVAAFVGYRMMDAGDHWASDVLFGAVLGYVVGHTVAGKDKKMQVAGCDMVPFFGSRGDAMGLGLVRQF
jgi:membrane-associated phospholipid phosphatase